MTYNMHNANKCITYLPIFRYSIIFELIFAKIIAHIVTLIIIVIILYICIIPIILLLTYKLKPRISERYINILYNGVNGFVEKIA